jgi:hypothetical protein
MQPEASPLLDQLKDIHGAGQPPWWPPAPGWWLVALLLLLLFVFIARKALRRLAERRRRKVWLAALDSLSRNHDPAANPHEFLAALNRLFRAVAVRAFPGTAAARIQGEEWVSFISSQMPEASGGECLSALASGPYEPAPRFDAPRLIEHARTWVHSHG